MTESTAQNVYSDINVPAAISELLSSRTCTEVSGVENIGQCGRLSQLSWLLGAL